MGGLLLTVSSPHLGQIGVLYVPQSATYWQISTIYSAVLYRQTTLYLQIDLTLSIHPDGTIAQKILIICYDQPE